jgi:hypothetical protein
MSERSNRPFIDLEAADLAALAGSKFPDLGEPAALGAVVENLVILRDHARILMAAAPAGEAAAATAGFEP